ncbi:MAG: hypothetical protein L0H70_06785, partial [Xanthomonadales bacterium]|nr:hypothetical protein [Xanthomonadales bacterium]
DRTDGFAARPSKVRQAASIAATGKAQILWQTQQFDTVKTCNDRAQPFYLRRLRGVVDEHDGASSRPCRANDAKHANDKSQV